MRHTMNNRGNRNSRARGARRGTVRNLQLRLSRLQRVQNGIKLRLNPDPPSFVQIPWNSCTVNDSPTLNSTSNSKVYKAVDICNIFKAQTGCSQANGQLSFRIMEVDVWEVSGKTLTLEVYDFTIGLGANDYLVQFEDVPGRNQWARTGYILPESQNKVVFSGDDTESLVTVTTGLAASLIVRFKLLWKFRFGTLPNLERASIETRVSHLESLLSKAVLTE